MEGLTLFLVCSLMALAYSDKMTIVEFEVAEEERLSTDEEVFVEKMFEKIQHKDKPVRLGIAQWKDCGGDSSLVTFKSLSIEDPVIEGNLKLSATVNVRKTLDDLKHANVTLFESILGKFVKIPCIDNIGSCLYDADLCSLLQQITQCPKELVQIGINCRCPQKPGVYDLENAQFTIPVIPSGSYEAIASVTTGSGDLAVCIQLQLSFT